MNKLHSNGPRLDLCGTPELLQIINTGIHNMKQAVSIQITQILTTVGNRRPTENWK